MTVINFSTYIKKKPIIYQIIYDKIYTSQGTDANSHRSINLKTKLF